MLRGCMQRHTIKCNFFSRDAYVIQVTVGRVYHPMKLLVLILVFLGQVALDSVVTKAQCDVGETCFSNKLVYERKQLPRAKLSGRR